MKSHKAHGFKKALAAPQPGHHPKGGKGKVAHEKTGGKPRGHVDKRKMDNE